MRALCQVEAHALHHRCLLLLAYVRGPAALLNCGYGPPVSVNWCCQLILSGYLWLAKTSSCESLDSLHFPYMSLSPHAATEQLVGCCAQVAYSVHGTDEPASASTVAERITLHLGGLEALPLLRFTGV